MKNHGRELPESTPVSITELSLTRCMYMGKGDGADFWVSLDQGKGNTVFSTHFGNNINCKEVYNGSTDSYAPKQCTRFVIFIY